MATPVINSATPKLVTASAVIRTGAWEMVGLFISSLGSGGIEIFDAITSGSNTVLPILTFSTGTFYSLPMTGANGLTVRVSGTAAAVLIWNPVN